MRPKLQTQSAEKGDLTAHADHRTVSNALTLVCSFEALLGLWLG